MAALRLSLAGALVLCLAVVQIAAASGGTLRGAVNCLDCAPDRKLSGVVVAVKCGNVTGLRAAKTDARGWFKVAVPTAAEAGSSGSRCAARILGGPEQLCAPPEFTASRVVAGPGRPGSYTLASRLAVSTSCAATTTTAVATMTTTAGSAAAETTTAIARLPGIDSPLHYNLGLPLNLLFPFFPVISGGVP